MSRVIHFEIHANNAERAIMFYESVFGWNFSKLDAAKPYWLIKTGSDNEPGINGGLLQRQVHLNGQGLRAFVCTVSTESIDLTSEKVIANGGQIAVPKSAVPQVGWLTYIRDTEGNIVGVLQQDPNAA